MIPLCLCNVCTMCVRVVVVVTSTFVRCSEPLSTCACVRLYFGYGFLSLSFARSALLCSVAVCMALWMQCHVFCDDDNTLEATTVTQLYYLIDTV